MPENIKNYNPSAPGLKGTIFGLPHGKEEAEVVVYPVPWEATVSYNSGTAFGPRAILDASVQLGLDLPHRDSPWKRGIWMSPMDGKIKSKSDILRTQIEPYIASLTTGQTYNNSVELLEKVNKSTDSLRQRIKQETLALIQEGKYVGVLGGDHSCALGFVEALAETHQDFGVLQIDAHMDLREAYEGFQHSHASVMFNVMKLKEVTQLVQVGIRDFCEEELGYVHQNENRITVFYDQVIKQRKFEGVHWKTVCEQIIAKLPPKVYVSFDIGGLNPLLCPGTGAPVPGGLDYSEAVYLLQQVKASGRQIIGFDLCEVAPQPYDQQWNANVGARVLYQLCGLVG
ncbi:agmatinase family protein [Reichenbachiella agarivorans]|uniref:Agmatinase family protein n=1 Tax=Reichenbachiella agarivorans TaxID=2979464 RepID=A0ABY6CPC0_9BACT|nr:agmatinase family protein [Reichenbachiella agarivorans]UXP32371.1 agmatinase family protein [Reichenbachiella agarivorans]